MSVVIFNPGDLRTSITLQTPTINKDAGGAQKAAYTNASTNPTILARWVNEHGSEVVIGGLGAGGAIVQNVQRATVVIRTRTDITTTWRVLKDGDPWNIISLDLIRGQNRWLELVVERAKGTI